MPHPNLVPVRPSVSRRTHSNGICAGTSTFCRWPLTLKLMAAIESSSDDGTPLKSGIKHHLNHNRCQRKKYRGDPPAQESIVDDLSLENGTRVSAGFVSARYPIGSRKAGRPTGQPDGRGSPRRSCLMRTPPRRPWTREG